MVYELRVQLSHHISYVMIDDHRAMFMEQARMEEIEVSGQVSLQ